MPSTKCTNLSLLCLISTLAAYVYLGKEQSKLKYLDSSSPSTIQKNTNYENYKKALVALAGISALTSAYCLMGNGGKRRPFSSACPYATGTSRNSSLSRKVSGAAERLRQSFSSTPKHMPNYRQRQPGGSGLSSGRRPSSTSELAALASAEISSFIAQNS